VFTKWEFYILSYLQETKVESMHARRAIASTFIYENFVYGEILRWYQQPETQTQ